VPVMIDGEDLEQSANLTAAQTRRIEPLHLKIAQKSHPEALHHPPPGFGAGIRVWL